MLTPIITTAGNSLSLGYAKPFERIHHAHARSRAAARIRGLSCRARNNMREINRMPSYPTRFVVLNFPPTVPIDPAFLKHAIKILGQRLNRRFPEHSTLWRVEFTQKGVPHIHLAGDFGFMSEGLLREWLFNAWRLILGFAATAPDNIVHVQVPLDSEIGVKVRYFCKSKKSDRIGTSLYCEQSGNTARCSGHFNRTKASLAPVKRGRATLAQRKEIETVLVGYLKQRMEDIKPGQDSPARQALIDKIASGKDACLNFLPRTLIEQVREILGNAA